MLHSPTTSSQSSLWLDADPVPPRPRLTGEATVDVAVIGGGITGLTTALLLAREGARVAVLEAGQLGMATTGCTTAKVSALQQTVYSTIRRHHGNETAAVYAAASAAGVERVAALAAEEDIACDLERRPAVTYAVRPGDASAVEQEAAATRAAGSPVYATEDAGLPFDVAAALRLDDQIAFHPVRYVRGLADALDGAIYEHSRAVRVEDGAPCRVHTNAGVLVADQVVVATHYPLLDRGLFFARLEPMRSYCIAARVEGELAPLSMAISAGGATRSMRAYGDVLVVGGEGHTTGSADATPARFAALEAFAREYWDVAEVTHRWSAQDPVPYDHLPVVGRYTPFSSRVYVASGFMKWGLSGGTMAAMLLADLIAGREHPWAEHFSPSRLTLRGAPKLAEMNTKVAIHFVGDRAAPAQARSASDVPTGQARVVRDGLGKAGVYRDDHGMIHAVSLRCTHLGCLLRFNAAERSWDCPCHGSRFGLDGEVLEGPATRPLAKRREL